MVARHPLNALRCWEYSGEKERQFDEDGQWIDRCSKKATPKGRTPLKAVNQTNRQPFNANNGSYNANDLQVTAYEQVL
jgi:hypothetical protein